MNLRGGKLITSEEALKKIKAAFPDWIAADNFKKTVEGKMEDGMPGMAQQAGLSASYLKTIIRILGGQCSDSTLGQQTMPEATVEMAIEILDISSNLTPEQLQQVSELAQDLKKNRDRPTTSAFDNIEARSKVIMAIYRQQHGIKTPEQPVLSR